MNAAEAIRSDLHCDMWFEQPEGMQFKVTVVMKNCTNEEILDIARKNWDFNVHKCGCRAVSARP